MERKYREGDLVRVTRACSGAEPGVTYKVGPRGYLVDVDAVPRQPLGIYEEMCDCTSNFILVSAAETLNTQNNETLMTSVTTFLKKISRQEPEKTFVEVGFLDENENVTAKGKEALEYILWDANKEALKGIADKIAEAEKGEK